MTGATGRNWPLIPTSIGGRGALIVSAAVLAVACPAFLALHMLMADADRAAAGERAALLGALCEFAGDQPAFHDAPTPSAALTSATHAAGRDVIWIGAFSDDGACRELHGHGRVNPSDIWGRLHGSSGPVEVTPLAGGGVDTADLTLLSAPRPDRGVVLAAVFANGAASRGALDRFWPLLGLGVLSTCGILLAWAGLRYGIEHPIRDLSRRLTALHTGLRNVSLDHSVPRELEAIVRSMKDVSDEVERWKVEAAYLRYSVETAIDRRTRKAEQEARRAAREADTDALTGLGNRRKLERELPALVAAGGRGDELSLLVIDIDRFKAINDTYGHAAGDLLLGFLGELIGSSTRRGSDLACRLGGDEFVIALPGAMLAEAAQTARQLAALFAQRVRSQHMLDPPPALSVGVAAVRANGLNTAEALLRAADQAMYDAKRRRQIVALCELSAPKPPPTAQPLIPAGRTG